MLHELPVPLLQTKGLDVAIEALATEKLTVSSLK
jgi:hypothetical protein